MSTRRLPPAALRTSPRRPRKAPEAALQRACVEILDRFVPAPPDGPAWTAVNPVPAKSRAVAGLSKALGMRAGWPDLQLIWRGRAVTIEMKAGKDGRLSDAQKKLRTEITLAGGLWHEVRSVDEFLDFLDVLAIPHRVIRPTKGQ